MDAYQTLAVVLLIGRLLAVNYLFKVLSMQIALLKLPIDLEVWDFRKKLHYQTIALFVGNFPAIILDLLVIVGYGSTAGFLVAYTVFNMLTMLIAAKMIYEMYTLSRNTKEVNDLEVAHLKK